MSVAAEWVILNYDILGRHLDDLLRRAVGGDRVRRSALPEEPHSARSKLSRQLTATAAATTPALAVQLLTGTPLTSRPRDLFVLLQLAAHPLGRSFLSFAKRYARPRRGAAGRRAAPRTSKS